MQLDCNKRRARRGARIGLLALLLQVAGLGLHLAAEERPTIHGGALAFAEGHAHAAAHDAEGCGVCRDLLRSAARAASPARVAAPAPPPAPVLAPDAADFVPAPRRLSASPRAPPASA